MSVTKNSISLGLVQLGNSLLIEEFCVGKFSRLIFLSRHPEIKLSLSSTET